MAAFVVATNANASRLLRAYTKAEALRKRREAELDEAAVQAAEALRALVDEVGGERAAKMVGLTRSAVYQRFGRLRA